MGQSQHSCLIKEPMPAAIYYHILSNIEVLIANGYFLLSYQVLSTVKGQIKLCAHLESL